MAAAMTAGAAALVKQRNPGYTPPQIKSALVNTAGTGVNDAFGQARVVAMGAGKLGVAGPIFYTATAGRGATGAEGNPGKIGSALVEQRLWWQVQMIINCVHSVACTGPAAHRCRV